MQLHKSIGRLTPRLANNFFEDEDEDDDEDDDEDENDAPKATPSLHSPEYPA
jgi:hypothetical protein